MAGRKDGQTRTEPELTRRTDGGIGRRRLLQLAGTGLAATVGVGTVAGASSGETAAGATRSGDGQQRVPVGGGAGYGDAVTEADADTVVSSSGDLADALDAAAAGDVVFVPGDATLELGDESYPIPSRVTLASDRGVDGSSGALLTTDAEPDDLVRMQAGARLSGVRLSGPNPGDEGGSSSYATGVATLGDAVTVDNCDIWGFSYAGVHIDAGWAHVHHNVIRECNKGGLGYGISQGAGYNGIEYNYFNFNRHSVASSGDHKGYVCRYNHVGPEATSYAIDAHDPACVRIKVHNNVVELYERTHGGHAGDPVGTCKVRGVPDDLASYRDNWFFNPKEPRDSPAGNTGEAIVQWADVSDWRNVEFSGNHYGEDANVTYSDVIPGYDGWRTA